MGIKEIWRDPVWSKVISWAIIGILIAVGTSALAHWSVPVRDALITAWNYITGSAVIARWIVAVLVAWAATASLLLYLIVSTLRARESKPTWRTYSEDEFVNLRWRWRLSEAGAVLNLNTFCISCDLQLTPSSEGYGYGSEGTKFECTNCRQKPVEFDQPHYEVADNVSRRIQLAIRDGSWQQARRKGQLIFAGTE